jgi:glycosyltransferase involved in cell wall biosynthesis
VSVAPYRYGEGTKLKVLEAMACGVAVVSTTIGCQGINVRNGENILVADTPEAFVEGVVRLLRDATERTEIGNRGRKLIEQEYAWAEIVGTLDPKLAELVRERQAS